MDESELVQRFKSGDKAAFDLLYDKYKNVTLRMVYLVCGNPADSEDIVQETFVKCYLHIGELKNVEGFRSWLFQILYRTAYHFCRRKGRELPREDIAVQVDLSCAGRQGFRDDAQETVTSAWVLEAVNKLGMKHRTVIVLYYYNGFSTKEIAGIMSCTEGTVKSRLFNARKQLKTLLQPQDDTAGAGTAGDGKTVAAADYGLTAGARTGGMP